MEDSENAGISPLWVSPCLDCSSVLYDCETDTYYCTNYGKCPHEIELPLDVVADLLEEIASCSA